MLVELLPAGLVLVGVMILLCYSSRILIDGWLEIVLVYGVHKLFLLWVIIKAVFRCRIELSWCVSLSGARKYPSRVLINVWIESVFALLLVHLIIILSLPLLLVVLEPLLKLPLYFFELALRLEAVERGVHRFTAC